MNRVKGQGSAAPAAPALQITQPSPTYPPEPIKTSFTHESERKVVTALFSDLTGYTALAERLDPEQVKEITGEVFAGVRRVIAQYEGFIDRRAISIGRDLSFHRSNASSIN